VAVAVVVVVVVVVVLVGGGTTFITKFSTAGSTSPLPLPLLLREEVMGERAEASAAANLARKTEGREAITRGMEASGVEVRQREMEEPSPSARASRRAFEKVLLLIASATPSGVASAPNSMGSHT